MKKLRFKKQKHLIAHWLKRLEFRRKPKPIKPPELYVAGTQSAIEWEQRVAARLKGRVV